MQEQLKLI